MMEMKSKNRTKRSILDTIGAALSLGLVLSFASTAKAQVLADITGDIDQYGVMVPGIACKTRTNNEATVRNLAHGVWNKESNSLVALNCGWPAPRSWLANVFANNARVNGGILIYFNRASGTTISDANDTFCSVSISSTLDTALNPNSNGVQLGTLTPNFSGLTNSDETVFRSVVTTGITYPDGFNFFSAFCQLAKGVRIQLVNMRPDSIGSF